MYTKSSNKFVRYFLDETSIYQNLDKEIKQKNSK